MVVVDFECGELFDNWLVKEDVVQCFFYVDWLQKYCCGVVFQFWIQDWQVGEFDFLWLQIVMGFIVEDFDLIIEDMVVFGKELIYCMGDDIFLVVFFDKFYLFYDYFKQCFVQVINFLIDFLWEKLVMSLEMYLGECWFVLKFYLEVVFVIYLEMFVLNEVELVVISEQGLFVKMVFIQVVVELCVGGL